MIHCVRGCTRRDRHLTDCPGAEECTGCEPRRADHGHLCRTCHGRLTEAISEAPELIHHARAHVLPGANGMDKVRGTKTPPAPGSLDAMDAADRLYAELLSWANTTADDLNLTRPDVPAWVPPGSDGQAAGLKAGGLGDATTVARFLTRQLDRIVEEPWVGEMVTELTGQTRKIRDQWPREERPQWLPTPCPACDLLTLTRYAPTWVGGMVTITCRNEECGETVPEKFYDFYAKTLSDEKKEEKRIQARELARSEARG